jgi:ABC-type sugar transport system ATPase subunit
MAKCMPWTGCRSRSTKERSTCCSDRRVAANRRRFASSPGLEPADGGRIFIAGRDVTTLPPSQRNIAMVFQSYALFPHLPVSENIVFGLKVRKVAPADVARRLAQVADLLGLSGLLDRKPSQLSGGQQAARATRPRDHQ